MDYRRAHDKFPQEIKEIIYAASEAGAEKALLKLGHEIARTGIKKVLYAIGVAVVGVLSALTAWITTSHPPK